MAGSREPKGQTEPFLKVSWHVRYVLSTRNCAQKRNHYAHHKPRMKQSKDRARRDQRRPQPSSRATSQTEPLARPRPLNDHAHSLHEKIRRWESVPRSSRNGNDQIVQEP